MPITINRRDALRLTGSVTAAGLLHHGVPAWAGGVARRPNVLLITGCDHPAAGIGAYGSRLARFDPTPTLDRLAGQGTLFTNAAADTIANASDEMPASVAQAARSAGIAGYDTVMIGAGLRGLGIGVSDAAFDLPGDTPLESYGHTTDRLTDLALDWLARRDDLRPFFLAQCYDAPRDVFAYAPRYENFLTDVTIARPDNFAGQSPAVDQPDDVTMNQAYQACAKGFLRCVRTIDDNLARLFNALKQADMWHDTVIIYTAHSRPAGAKDAYIDNRWFHGGTWQVPLILRHPHIEHPTAISDLPVSSANLLASLMFSDFNAVNRLVI